MPDNKTSRSRSNSLSDEATKEEIQSKLEDSPESQRKKKNENVSNSSGIDNPNTSTSSASSSTVVVSVASLEEVMQQYKTIVAFLKDQEANKQLKARNAKLADDIEKKLQEDASTSEEHMQAFNSKDPNTFKAFIKQNKNNPVAWAAISNHVKDTAALIAQAQRQLKNPPKPLPKAPQPLSQPPQLPVETKVPGILNAFKAALESTDRSVQTALKNMTDHWKQDADSSTIDKLVYKSNDKSSRTIEISENGIKTSDSSDESINAIVAALEAAHPDKDARKGLDVTIACDDAKALDAVKAKLSAVGFSMPGMENTGADKKIKAEVEGNNNANQSNQSSTGKDKQANPASTQFLHSASNANSKSGNNKSNNKEFKEEEADSKSSDSPQPK